MEDFLQFFDDKSKEKIVSISQKLQTLGEKQLETGKNIAEIILPLKLDIDTYIACLVLPFLEEDIILDEKEFLEYENAINLAKTVMTISSFDYKNQQNEMENLRAMLLAIAKDIRVMVIRLAEVVNSARHIKEYSEEFAKTLFYEINEIYSPIASRLGLTFIKSELNDLSLLFYHPTAYKKLLKQVAEDSRNGKDRIDATIEKIKTIMKNMGINGDCYGRVKHISSLYNKLQEKNKNLSQVYDLCALRVIVENQNDCYTILGAIHTEFVPLDGRFKDYIARPKANGYQSLHTVVLIDEEPLEIQIRTKEMHEHAEYGIAAHFLYKEHKNKMDLIDDKLLWIKKLLENKDDVSASELLEGLKTDVYSGEIFVQSPMGKIIQLVENSTPIDFAYAIHSEIGNKCVGARINGKMMPLSTTLNNGDIVEIITNQNAKGPSRDWLKIAKTASAKTRINQFFRREMKEENIKKGKAILEQNAKIKGYNLKDLLDEKYLFDVLEKYAFHNEDEMFAAVGYGSLTSLQVLNKLVDNYEKYNKIQTKQELKIVSEKEHSSSNSISELDGIMVKYAKCCGPIPGDEIVGFVSRGSGVTVHRKDCALLSTLEHDRIMELKWDNDNNTENNYVASLKLFVDNTPGVLATISTKISENKLNITKISSSPANQEEAVINISFYISSKQELDEFINKLQALPIVHSVLRGGK